MKTATGLLLSVLLALLLATSHAQLAQDTCIKAHFPGTTFLMYPITRARGTTFASAAAFYQYGTPSASSANTGLEVKERLQLAFIMDTSDRLDFAAVYDAPGNDDGGNAYCTITLLDGNTFGGSGMSLLVNDDSGEYNYFFPGGDKLEIDRVWSTCCTDGWIIGHIPLPQVPGDRFRFNLEFPGYSSAEYLDYVNNRGGSNRSGSNPTGLDSVNLLGETSFVDHTVVRTIVPFGENEIVEFEVGICAELEACVGDCHLNMMDVIQTYVDTH